MPKILLVEDDHDLVQSIVLLLEQKLMTVDTVNAVSRAKDFLSIAQFDLIILDWNLADGEGISLLRFLRDSGQSTPVLMLTSRAAIKDKIQGFEQGSDDYLAKPFHPEELICRIHALLRRPVQTRLEHIEHRGLRLDLGKRTAERNGKIIPLTPREFELLEFLLCRLDQVFSKDVLLERVWKSDSESTAETVVTTVLRLRKKIDVSGEPSIIRNVFGSGYVIDKS